MSDPNDLNEMKKLALRTDMGVNAKVQRERFSGELVTKSNRKLNEIGEEMNPKPDALTYLGSIAVHVYQSEQLKQVFYATQVDGTIQKIPHALAPYVTRELTGAVMEHFGRKRQVWRSGL